jgi:hypothetical protein
MRSKALGVFKRRISKAVSRALMFARAVCLTRIGGCIVREPTLRVV